MMGGPFSRTKVSASVLVRNVGGALVLGVWLVGAASAGYHYGDAWAPPPREPPVPAAEPNTDEPPSSDPKPSSLDDVPEPTPV